MIKKITYKMKILADIKDALGVNKFPKSSLDWQVDFLVQYRSLHNDLITLTFVFKSKFDKKYEPVANLSRHVLRLYHMLYVS